MWFRFFLTELDPTEQEQYFLAQLRLARDLDLAVIVHARRAVDAVLKCIRRIGALRGVVHSFAGSVEQAQHVCASWVLWSVLAIR